MTGFSKMALTLVASLAVGCATNRSADSDKTNPNYYKGGQVGIPLGPDGTTVVPPGLALVADAIALATIPDYYRDTVIRGSLDCRAIEGTQLLQPCPTAVVILKGPDGKELARTQSEKGVFAFKVDKRGSYSLELKAPHYRVASHPAQGLHSGDEVVVLLVRE